MRRTTPRTTRSPAPTLPTPAMTPALRTAVAQIPEAQRGPLESAIDRVMGSSAHLWHGRHGITTSDGKWKTAPKAKQATVRPGFFQPAAVALYRDLLYIYTQNALLFAHLASWALRESDWKDLKVALAALLFVQPVSMFRDVAEAMVLSWDKSLGKRAFSTKMVSRVGEFLSDPAIARMNREAKFCSAAGKQAFKGRRWEAVVKRYLLIRERNPFLLEGLVKAGYRDTLMDLARRCHYRPETTAFFQTLRWEQDQATGGHRTVAIGMAIDKRTDSFEGLSEEQICRQIVSKKLKYAEVVGRLPREMGLTQAIMVSLLPCMSDRDVVIATPTLEDMGLLQDAGVRARWDRAVKAAEDQRGLNILKNVKSADLKDKLEEAAGAAVQKAVKEAVPDNMLRVMFLIDTSSSQQGAVEKSIEIVPRILAGMGGQGGDKLHVASFHMLGTVIPIKGQKPSSIKQLLGTLKANGGTLHHSATAALHNSGVRQLPGESLIIMVVGDEEGEKGTEFARRLRLQGYSPSAFAILVNLGGYPRGRTVRDAAADMRLPFSEVELNEFDDPYSVPRVLRRILDAATPASVVAAAPATQTVVTRMGWIERVLATPLLVPPVVPPRAPRSEVV